MPRLRDVERSEDPELQRATFQALPLVSLIAVSAIWGVSYVQMKDAIAVYPTFSFLALRFGIAALALAAVAKLYGRRPLLPDRTTWWAGLWLGCLLSAGFGLHVIGLSRTSVTAAGFITGLLVPMTPLFAALLLRERLTRGLWLATTLAVVGLALLSGVHAGPSGSRALLLGGAAAFALHIVLTSRFAGRCEVAALTAVQILVCAVVFGALALTSESPDIPSETGVWSALVVTGLLATAVGYAIQTWAQKRASATQTAFALALEPVCAGLCGVLLSGDRLGAAGWLGCLGITFAIVVSQPALVARLAPGRRRQTEYECSSRQTRHIAKPASASTSRKATASSPAVVRPGQKNTPRSRTIRAAAP